MAELTTWRLRAETETEWVEPIKLIDVNTDTELAGYTLSLVPPGGTATVFTPIAVEGGEKGIVVGSETDWPMQRGRRYTIVARLEASPNSTPLIDVGIINCV